MSNEIVDPTLLEIMQCPSCGGSLKPGAAPPTLTCEACGLQYPVRSGIPVMLVEEAVPTKTPGAGEGR